MRRLNWTSSTSSQSALRFSLSSYSREQRAKPFEVAAALGKLYYSNSRFQDAAIYLKQAVDKTADARAALAQVKRAPSRAEGSCPEAAAQPTLESLTSAVRQRSIPPRFLP